LERAREVQQAGLGKTQCARLSPIPLFNLALDTLPHSAAQRTHVSLISWRSSTLNTTRTRLPQVALALLKLMREGSITYMDSPEYVKAMSQALQRTEYGVLTSATSLAVACGLRYTEEYEACVPDAITMLHRLTMKGCDDAEYV
jgi:hypothetical protein